MADNNCKLSLKEEERLAEEVKLYPCVFDKSDPGYKEKDCVENAWNEIARKLNFIENVVSGIVAKSSFERLRKRYNKKKNDVKKSKKSGSSIKESEKAEKALSEYRFLSWLDTFIHIREGKNNLPDTSQGRNEVFEESADEYEDEENDAVSVSANHNEDTCSEVGGSFIDSGASSRAVSPPVFQSPPEQRKRKVPVKEIHNKRRASEDKKAANYNKDNYLNEMELSLIKSLKDDVTKGNNNKELDSIDLYVRSLAEDLRKLNETDFLMAKHEIQNVVFKYQMARFGMNRSLLNQYHVKSSNRFGSENRSPILET